MKTPEGQNKLRRVRKHNSYIGHAAMMVKQCSAIYNSDSTTREAKQIALTIERSAKALAEALKTRID